jgi:NAD(P)-dependent dehydrogenase (short-subunit alcohol dehydrogenase family)
VTGANSGLGLIVARELARQGAGVVMAGRDPAGSRRRLSDSGEPERGRPGPRRRALSATGRGIASIRPGLHGQCWAKYWASAIRIPAAAVLIALPLWALTSLMNAP